MRSQLSVQINYPSIFLRNHGRDDFYHLLFLATGLSPVKANEPTVSQKSKLMNFSRSPDKNHPSRSKFRRQKRPPRAINRSLQRRAREGVLKHPTPPRSLPQSRNPGILRNTTYLACGVSNLDFRFAVGRVRGWPFWWHGR